MIRIEMETADIWKHTNGNIATIANVVHLWKRQLEAYFAGFILFQFVRCEFLEISNNFTTSKFVSINFNNF